MKILGLDPGMERVGFGLLHMTQTLAPSSSQWGVVHTHKTLSDAQRLAEIYTDIGEIVSSFQPNAVCMERLFYFKNQTTLIPVSQARGVLLLVCAQHNLPIYEFTPMQVKLQVAGYGKATKQEVQAMVKEQLKLDRIPKPDDAADALAIGMCIPREAVNTWWQEQPEHAVSL